MSRLSIADTDLPASGLYDASVCQSGNPGISATTGALLNSRLPTGFLPTDILEDIFQLAHRDAAHDSHWEVFGHEQMILVMRLSHVCGMWRATASGVPSLRATVFIFDICPKINLVKIFLERSRTCPLDLNFFLSQSADAAIPTFEHLGRWCMVRMRLGTFHVLREMVERLDIQMPHMETLSVLVTAIPDTAPHNISLQPSFSAPRLRVLALDNAPCLHSDTVSGTTFIHLVQLSLGHSAFKQYFSLVKPWKALCRLSAAFPHLSALSLSGRRIYFKSEDAYDTYPSFPALKSLTLDLEIYTIVPILYSMTARCLHTLTLVRLNAGRYSRVPAHLEVHFPALEQLKLNSPTGKDFCDWLARSIPHVRSIAISDADVNALLQAVRSVTFSRLVELNMSFRWYFDYTSLRAALDEQPNNVSVVRGATEREPSEELRAWFAARLETFEWRQWRTSDPRDYVELRMM